jgi:glycosyltransferase involved in cell wall biosynthesis
MTNLPLPQIPVHSRSFWKEKSSSACVLIPLINEGERIKSLVRHMHALGIPAQADIIFVDGGSTDGSLDRIIHEPLGVRGIITKTGPGKLSAQLRCGYAAALDEGYEHIVTIDGNDKDDPKAIPAFIAALREGVDFVQASRFVKGGIAENTPLVRWIAIRLIHAPALSLASGFWWTDTTQGFRGYSRRLLTDPRVNIFRDCFNRYELLAYLSYRAPRLKFRCIELPTARRYPAEGKVPTKISAVRGNWDLIITLAKTCLGKFNPRD